MRGRSHSEAISLVSLGAVLVGACAPEGDPIPPIFAQAETADLSSAGMPADVLAAGAAALDAIRARSPMPEAPCVVEAGQAAGRWGAIDADRGLFRGRLDMGAAEAGLAGRTLDARGPYGLFRGVVGQDGAPIGGLRGFYAAFHYTPGEGVFAGRLLRRDPACAESDE